MSASAALHGAPVIVSRRPGRPAPSSPTRRRSRRVLGGIPENQDPQPERAMVRAPARLLAPAAAICTKRSYRTSVICIQYPVYVKDLQLEHAAKLNTRWCGNITYIATCEGCCAWPK